MGCMVEVNKNYTKEAFEYPIGSKHRINWCGHCWQLRVGKRVTGSREIKVNRKSKKEIKEYSARLFRERKKHSYNYEALNDYSTHQLHQLMMVWRECGGTDLDELKAIIKKSKKKSIYLQDAIDDLYADKDRRGNHHHTMRTSNSRYNRVLEGLGNVKLDELSYGALEDWLDSQSNLKPRTKDNLLNALGEILKRAKKQKHIEENIVADLDTGERRSLTQYDSRDVRNATKLPLEVVRKLLKYSLSNEEEWGFTASIVLGLFSGIRTEEKGKLEWKQVKFDKDMVTISGDIAKKRRIRHVTLPENAKAWLMKLPKTKQVYKNWFDKDTQKTGKYILKNEYIGQASSRWTQFWKSFVKEYDLPYPTWRDCFNNGLRDSFGTYHYELYDNASLTIKEMGHKTDEILFAHYRDLVDEKGEGEEFFSIYPE